MTMSNVEHVIMMNKTVSIAIISNREEISEYN